MLTNNAEDCHLVCRAAAIRCRNKKKNWVNNLESKAGELQAINRQLVVETTRLRNEIETLKMALQDHTNCPPNYPSPVAS